MNLIREIISLDFIFCENQDVNQHKSLAGTHLLFDHALLSRNIYFVPLGLAWSHFPLVQHWLSNSRKFFHLHTRNNAS